MPGSEEVLGESGGLEFTLPSLRGPGQLTKEEGGGQSGQEEAHLSGVWGQEGDREKPITASVGAGEGTMTQTDVPTQRLCPNINHRK